MAEEPDAVTCWIGDLRRQSPDAQARIFELYFGSAVRLAGRRLGAARRRERDEEDVAISAMRSFFAGIAADRFDRLASCDDLWALIAVITSRKAIRQMRRLLSLNAGSPRPGRSHDGPPHSSHRSHDPRPQRRDRSDLRSV